MENATGRSAASLEVLEEASPSVSRGGRDGLLRILGLAATIALLITGTVTFLVLLGQTPIEPTDTVVATAIAINSALAIMLALLIAREIGVLFSARRKGRAAARLHVRIIGLFALVAAVPAILVAVVASITLDVGLDRWFETRTKQIVASSVSVAQAYMMESHRVLTGNTISMATDLDRARQVFSLDPIGFARLMTLQAKGRGFLGAQLLRRNGTLLSAADIPTERTLPKPREEFFEAADSGDPVAIPPGNTDFVGAMFKLKEIPDAYLYVIATLRPEVLQQLRLMEENTQEYALHEQGRLRVQIAFAVLYIGVCLIVLLAAIWTGISVADRFVSPIRRLITAADAVSAGNLDVRVGTSHTEGDLKNLNDTFNNMTSELRRQRDAILRANEDIGQRARFIEAVLSGASAGVLGVTRDGKVTIANPAALALFGDNAAPGAMLHDVSPDLARILAAAHASQRDQYRDQMTILHDGRERTLSIQFTLEHDEHDELAPDSTPHEHSFVVTIDDITDVVAAQRSTAWSDVARRIAHEIKNPLTPIQLSAERIRRRYGKYITQDKEIFDQCTDTIIRQVGDIGRMVDEFSAFARMPKPQIERRDLKETLAEAIFLQKVAFPKIEFATEFPPDKLVGDFDTRLLSQVFINVLKNAAEAIEANEKDRKVKGRILTRAYREGGRFAIDFIDNGKGLPTENRHRLLEPYMTTREKGTGLGLAIVRKIVEDHGGLIELRDAPAVTEGGTGALVRILLPGSGGALGASGDESAEKKKETARSDA